MLEVTRLYCVVGLVAICVEHVGSRLTSSSTMPCVVIIIGKEDCRGSNKW